MPGAVFINYRRDDTAEAAQAVYAQLSHHFSIAHLFMDTSSLEGGQDWPARIESALHQAKALLCIVGRHWLSCDDAYGRRRIDLDEDWVRREIEYALHNRTPLYPILIEDAQMPPAAALPDSIRDFAAKQALYLRRSTWMSDLRLLVSRLEEDGLLAEQHSSLEHPSYPDPAKQNKPALTEEALAERLKELDGWYPWTERVLREYPYERTELRRAIGFKSFRSAMRFMTEATEIFVKMGHHPRWGNEWRIVNVRLTTWDARNKITDRDIEVAKAVDALVDAHRASGFVVT